VEWIYVKTAMRKSRLPHFCPEKPLASYRGPSGFDTRQAV